MTFDVFEKIVNDVMNKKPILFELERDKIASDDEIQQVENSLHCTFPQNYKSFVKKYGGGYFGYTVVLSCDLQGKFYIGKYYDIYNQLFKDAYFLPLMDLETGDMLGVKINGSGYEDQMYLYLHDTNSFIQKEFDFLEAVIKYCLNTSVDIKADH